MALPTPIAAYNLNGNLTDATGNGYTLSGVGTPTYGTGIIGQDLTLNGSSQYATLADNSAFHLQAFTMNIWVKYSSVSGTQPVFSKNYASGSWSGPYVSWMLRFDGSASTPQYEIGINNNGSYKPFLYHTTPAVGTWYMLTYVYDGSNVILYINGTAVSTNPLTTTIGYSTGAFDLGSDNSGSEFFNGQQDAAVLFGQAITATQVSELYNGGAGLEYPYAPSPLSFNVSDTTALSDASVVAEGPLNPVSIFISETTSISDIQTVQIEAVPNLTFSISNSTILSDSVSVAVNAPSPLTFSVQDTTIVTDSAGRYADTALMREKINVQLGSPTLTFFVSDSSSVSDNTQIKTSALLLNTADATTITEFVKLRTSALLLNTSDTTAVTDSVSVATSAILLTVSDSTTVTDTVNFSETAPLISVSDATTISEYAALLLPYCRFSTNDTTAITDVPTIAVQNAPFLSIATSDAIVVTDTAAISELAPSALLFATSDIASMADQATTTIQSYVNTFDISTLSDTATLTVSAPQASATDTTPISDSVRIIIKSAGIVTFSIGEPVSVTDSATLITTPLHLATSDTVSATDTTSLAAPLLVSASDTTTLADAPTIHTVAINALTFSTSETTAITENATVVLSLRVNAQETATITENVNAYPTSLVFSTSDTTPVHEITVTHIPTDGIYVHDSVITSDSASIFLSYLTLVVSETVLVTEKVTNQIKINVQSSDVIAITEAVSAHFISNLSVSVSDSTAVTDTVTATSSNIQPYGTYTIALGYQQNKVYILSQTRSYTIQNGFLNKSYVINGIRDTTVQNSIINKKYRITIA